MLTALPATMVTLLFSYLFILAGCQKLSDIDYFRHVLRGYQVVPGSWAPLLARVLPVLEVCAGLALLIPSARDPALTLLTGLLVVYSAAITVNVVRGRMDIDCGCAGPGQQQGISAWLIGRNAVLLSLAVLAHSTPQAEAIGAVGWGVGFLGAILAALIYHACNQLIVNHALLKRIAHHG